MKHKRQTAVHCTRLLGDELALLAGLCGWVAEARGALLRAVSRVDRRYAGLGKWFRVERTTANRTDMRLLVVPTKTTRDLMAAAQTLCKHKDNIKRTAATKHLLNVLKRDFHKTVKPNVRGQAGRAKRVQQARERRNRPCLHRAC